MNKYTPCNHSLNLCFADLCIAEALQCVFFPPCFFPLALIAVHPCWGKIAQYIFMKYPLSSVHVGVWSDMYVWAECCKRSVCVCGLSLRNHNGLALPFIFFILSLSVSLSASCVFLPISVFPFMQQLLFRHCFYSRDGLVLIPFPHFAYSFIQFASLFL